MAQTEHTTRRRDFFIFDGKQNSPWKDVLQDMQTQQIKLLTCFQKFEKNGKVLANALRFIVI